MVINWVDMWINTYMVDFLNIVCFDPGLLQCPNTQ